MRILPITLGLIVVCALASACGDDPATGDKSSRRAATGSPVTGETAEAAGCVNAPLEFEGGDVPVFAYHGEDGYVWLSSADGSGSERLTPEPLGKSEVWWSPDGKALAYASESNALVLLDVASGSTASMDDVFDDGRRSSVAWAPDGRTIAFGKAHAANRTYVDLWISDVAGGARLAIEYGEPVEWSPDGTRIVYRRKTPPPDPTSVSPPPAEADDPAGNTLEDGISLFTVDTGVTELVDQFGFIPYQNRQSLWSPDSAFIAFWQGLPNFSDSGELVRGTLVAFNVATQRETLLPGVPFDILGVLPGWAPSLDSAILYNRRIDSTGAATVLFPEPLVVLSWAKDSESVAIVRKSGDRERELVVLDLAQDIETLIDTRTTIPGNDQYDFGAYAGQLSPDGSALAYIYLSHYTEDESSSLRLRELPGGEYTLIPSTHYQQMAYRPGLVDFSPSGNFLLIQVFNDPPPPSICVASAPDWRPSRIADGFPIGFEELGSWRPSVSN